MKSIPLCIRDDITPHLVARLATLRGLSKQDAVRLAVQAELDRAANAVPLRERLAQLRVSSLLPPSTGRIADQAFFDDLSGQAWRLARMRLR